MLCFQSVYIGLLTQGTLKVPCSLDIHLYWAVKMLIFWVARAEITYQPTEGILCTTGFYKPPGLTKKLPKKCHVLFEWPLLVDVLRLFYLMKKYLF